MENTGNVQIKELPVIIRPDFKIAHSQARVGRGKGTFIERDLFESPAFISLGGVAPQMLVYLLGKREFQKTKNTRICVNANELKLSYRELQKLGITQPRATRGFDELLAKGFIKIEHSGGGCQKDQSIYSLSDQYLLWRNGAKISKRPKAMSKGFTNGKKQIQHTNP